MTDKEKAIRWFENIADECDKLTSGNVAHLKAQIKGVAIRSAEYLTKHSQEPASEDLKKEIEKYFAQWYQGATNEGCVNSESQLVSIYDCKRIAKHFAQWQKEQMMKDAVEADIAESFTPVSESPNIYMHGFTCVYEEKESTPYVVAPCKVKLIIIKD